MSILIAVTAFVGFSRSYFLKELTGTPALPLAVHFHGVVATGWILLFVVQTTLITRGQVRRHRGLGSLGAALALLVVVSSFAAGIAMTDLRGNTPEAYARLGAPFVAAPVFAVLVGCGLIFRSRPDIHKRLMLLATINALTPAFGRLPYLTSFLPASFYAAVSLFLLACVVNDLISERRIHVATVAGSALVMASVPARFLLGHTAFWQAFAAKLME